MQNKSVYKTRQYLQKIVNTFSPRILLKCSLKRNWAKKHWAQQKEGDMHGFDKYCSDRPTVAIMLSEIQRLVKKDAPILDLGCNCGYYLSRLKMEGYTHLSGVDICGNAIAYGKEHLSISDVEMISGGFEEVLPELCSEHRTFSLVYTVGATVELVHPSFDIVKYICAISDEFVVMIISLWGHAYPRFWEYEFNRNGFVLVKCITPENGNNVFINDLSHISSLLVFKKVK